MVDSLINRDSSGDPVLDVLRKIDEICINMLAEESGPDGAKEFLFWLKTHISDMYKNSDEYLKDL